MEPRPPRPRQYPPLDPSTGAYPRPGSEQGMYAPPPGQSAGPPAYPAEPPLIPRQERQRQRIARAVLIIVLVVAVIGVAGWNLRDRFFGLGQQQQQATQIDPTPPEGLPEVEPNPATPAGESPTEAAIVSNNNLLATATATPERGVAEIVTREDEAEPEAPAAEEEDPAASEADEPASAPLPADLTELLPDETELPVEGLAVSDSGDRSLNAVVGTFGSDLASQQEAREFLTERGWSQNVYRDFAGDPSLLTPDATSVLTVSIHQFGSPEAAAEALTYFSNVVVAVQGFDEVQADPLGDQIRLLRGVGEDGTTNVAAYIADGPLLYRLGGSSPAGDPTSHVLQLASQLINDG